MIKVALIGKGYWGSKIQKYLLEDERFCIKGVYDSQSCLRREVFDNHSIEAVILATPNSTHYPIAKEAILSKKHVMCEKPLALNSSECIELDFLSKDRNVVLCTEYTHTFSKSIILAKKMIENGDIGEICNIEMQMKQLGQFGKGNAYWLLASHMLAVLDMFIPIEEQNFQKRDLIVNNGIVETGLINFNKKNVYGNILVSLNYPSKIRNIVIQGSNGKIEYNPLMNQSLHLVKDIAQNQYGTKKYEKYFEFDESNNLKYAIDYFYSVIIGEEESNIKRSIAVTKILEELHPDTTIQKYLF